MKRNGSKWIESQVAFQEALIQCLLKAWRAFEENNTNNRKGS